VIAGQGLHTGAQASVRFERAPGPITFVQDGASATLAELEVASVTRSTTLATRDGRVRIGTVEHVLTALSALAIRRDLRMIVEGPEMPLADGGAAAFHDALTALGIDPSPPELVVARAGEIAVGESRYVFEPGAASRLEVSIDFDDPRIARGACWDGSAASFRSSIAIARTFGFAHEVEALAARGLASHVAPESVVVVAKDAVLFAGRPFSPDEPARHKLLDLAGDLFVHGGPPRGRVHAHRPGHAATHEAVRRAEAAGILDRLHRSLEARA
jgi:UDP-3-O-acyl-N-acetylglucosamine deacetylase